MPLAPASRATGLLDAHHTEYQAFRRMLRVRLWRHAEPFRLIFDCPIEVVVSYVLDVGLIQSSPSMGPGQSRLQIQTSAGRVTIIAKVVTATTSAALD